MIDSINTTICPQCGAKGTAGRFCEYCGTKIPMPEVKKTDDEDFSLPYDRIIPFSSSAEDIKNMVLDELVNREDVPVDVFEKIQDIAIKKLYIPMYNFVGSFEAMWNCTQIISVERSRKVYGRDGDPNTEYYYENEYHPANGIAVGSFDILCSTSPLLKEYDYENYDNSQPYEESLVDADAEVHTFCKDKQEIWKSVASDIIDMKTGHEASMQAPTFHTDLRVSRKCSTDKTLKVLVPIWLISFSYDGIDYITTLRGDKPLSGGIVVPEHKAYKNKINKKISEVKAKEPSFLIILTMVGVILLLSAASMISIVVYENWILCLVLFMLVPITFYLMITIGSDDKNKLIKEIEEEIKKETSARHELRKINAKRYFDYGDVDIKEVN